MGKMLKRQFVKSSLFLSMLPVGLGGCDKLPQSQSELAGEKVQEHPQTSQLGTHKLDHFGLQLSTVTPLMLADFEGTLAKVAEIGYRQVEFSAMGFLGRSAAQVKQLLGHNDLYAPVGRITPTLPGDFMSLPRDQARKIYAQRSSPQHLIENVKHSLDSALELEQKYLNLPAMMPDNFASLDQVKSNIELLNEVGALCASHGVLFGYHNHNWELTPLDGVIPYDLMLEQTQASTVAFQLDAYWIVKGGGDLSDYLRRFPGRFPSCHLKDIDDNGGFADVGAGQINFPKFVRQAKAAGTQHFFVERDNPPAPEQSIRNSFTYLQNMTF